MKEMTLPITSVSSSYSFPDDGRRRVLGTFSPGGMWAHRTRTVSYVEPRRYRAMWSPPRAFLPLSQGCPRIPMTRYAPGAWGRKCLGLLRSWWGPLHLVVKPPELVTAAHETWSWNPLLRKERFRGRQAVLWALRRFPCVHLPGVHPHAGRNQVGTDYPLWPDMWEIGDPLRITCTFSDLGDILITQKPPLDNKKNKCLSLHLFVSEESYILLCRYT